MDARTELAMELLGGPPPPLSKGELEQAQIGIHFAIEYCDNRNYDDPSRDVWKRCIVSYLGPSVEPPPSGSWQIYNDEGEVCAL